MAGRDPGAEKGVERARLVAPATWAPVIPHETNVLTVMAGVQVHEVDAPLSDDRR
jgi:hypothetical protein